MLQPTGKNRTLSLLMIHVVYALTLMHWMQAAAAQKKSVLGKRSASQAALTLLEQYQQENRTSIKKIARQDSAFAQQKYELRNAVRTLLKKKTPDKSLYLRCPECATELSKNATLLGHYLNFHYQTHYVCCVCKVALSWNKFENHRCDETGEMDGKTDVVTEPSIVKASLPAFLDSTSNIVTAPLIALSPTLTHLVQLHQSVMLALKTNDEAMKNIDAVIAGTNTSLPVTTIPALHIQEQATPKPGALESPLSTAFETPESVARPLQCQPHNYGFLALQEMPLHDALQNAFDE